MITPPLEYHLIRVPGDLVYCVDAATAHEVWDWITEWYNEGYTTYLDITTIDGGDVTLIRGQVISLEQTNPEIRRFNRQHEKMMQEERVQQGFLD